METLSPDRPVSQVVPDLSTFSLTTCPQGVEESVLTDCPQVVEHSVPWAVSQAVNEPSLSMHTPQEVEVHNSVFQNVSIMNHAQSLSQAVDDSTCVQQVASIQEQIGTSSPQSAFQARVPSTHPFVCSSFQNQDLNQNTVNFNNTDVVPSASQFVPHHHTLPTPVVTVSDDPFEGPPLEFLLASSADLPHVSEVSTTTDDLVSHRAQDPGNLLNRDTLVSSSLAEAGVSQNAINLLQESHRSGTRKVYSSKWKKWVEWCLLHRVDPIFPPAPDLANFLAELANSGLRSPTIEGYRSAILTSLKQLGGAVRLEEQFPFLISGLIRGIAARDATNPRRYPEWDLFLVLDHLAKTPFEPLSELDISALTKKTVFLVTLALGRRSSEVNGLSGLPSDVARLQDGSFVLKFLPEFLAKNQNPSSPSPSVKVPSLTAVTPLGSREYCLCPARALRCYLARSRRLRDPSLRKLFTSVNPEYKRDIGKSTVSRWLSDVIRDAYSRASEQPNSFRAHELRAWSASLALSANVSLEAVLDAAFWSSPNSFIQHYLRDVAARRADGTSKIARVAVAQTTVRL